MNKQEIFNTVLVALRKQGHASVQPKTSRCLYRGPNGDKCAAGHLMSDAEYDMAGLRAMQMDSISNERGIEGKRASSLHNYGVGGVFAGDDDQRDFLNKLQEAHDNSLTRSTDAWEQNMKSIAMMEGLIYQSLENI